MNNKRLPKFAISKGAPDLNHAPSSSIRHTAMPPTKRITPAESSSTLDEATELLPPDTPLLREAARKVKDIRTSMKGIHNSDKDFRQLAEDASQLVITLCRAYTEINSRAPESFFGDVIEELLQTLQNIINFAEEKLHRKSLVRLINKSADSSTIKQFREDLNHAKLNFTLHSHILIHSTILDIWERQECLQSQAGPLPITTLHHPLLDSEDMTTRLVDLEAEIGDKDKGKDKGQEESVVDEDEGDSGEEEDGDEDEDEEDQEEEEAGKPVAAKTTPLTTENFVGSYTSQGPSLQHSNWPVENRGAPYAQAYLYNTPSVGNTSNWGYYGIPPPHVNTANAFSLFGNLGAIPTQGTGNISNRLGIGSSSSPTWKAVVKAYNVSLACVVCTL
ncbi:hypothetical protein B0H34DRAFT_680354 [Crassisporium funariophilum]|nr:hypothetical protein B0H34DRAFT_680354 [Crassisporium funariophilum]